MINKHVIEIENVRSDYIRLVNWVQGHGERVSPRGQLTYELSCFTVIHHRPTDSIVHGIGRGENQKIAAAEALQLVGGFSDPERMAQIQPNFRNFMDGGALYGAYGPRIAHQMQRAVDKLKEDKDTRQARVSIWRDSDLFSDAKDLPCTLGFTFHVRNDKLSMHTHMRSNDVWWGFTYDITQFCALQLAVADLLMIDAGPYYHHVDSFHLYDRDDLKVEKLHVDAKSLTQRQTGFGYSADGWSGIVKRARSLFYEDTEDGHVRHELERMLKS